MNFKNSEIIPNFVNYLEFERAQELKYKRSNDVVNWIRMIGM